MYSTCAHVHLLSDIVREAFLPTYIIHYNWVACAGAMILKVTSMSWIIISLYEKNILEEIFYIVYLHLLMTTK